jgi:Ca2+-binding EF-hand superfamily protein
MAGLPTLRLVRLTVSDPTLYRAVIQQLYALFDVNHDGTVDFTELMAGLSVVCGGSGRQRVETVFKLFGTWTFFVE